MLTPRALMFVPVILGVIHALWDNFVVGIFLTNFCFSDIFLSNQNFLSYYITLIFIHFYNVYVLQDDYIIRNSSLPLLGGRKIPRQNKEKHSIF